MIDKKAPGFLTTAGTILYIPTNPRVHNRYLAKPLSACNTIKRLVRSQHDSLITAQQHKRFSDLLPRLTFLQLCMNLIPFERCHFRPHATTTGVNHLARNNSIKALSRMRPWSHNSSQRDTATISLPAVNVTPDNTRTSIEQLMSRKATWWKCDVRWTRLTNTPTRWDISRLPKGQIFHTQCESLIMFDSRFGTWQTYSNWSIIMSTQHRYGIIRDNLPPSIEYSTSDDELLQAATSIEKRLYRAATSSQAYRALSTLEFRITALATAVLILSDEFSDQDGRNISHTCARLSAAARKSLVYCVMILLFYEKQKLDNGTGRKMASEKLEESWQRENLHQEHQLHWKYLVRP